MFSDLSINYSNFLFNPLIASYVLEFTIYAYLWTQSGRSTMACIQGSFIQLVLRQIMV